MAIGPKFLAADDQQRDAPPSQLPKYAIITGVVVLVLFVAATVVMFRMVLPAAAAESWNRAIVLYNPIVSLAFTAVGVLLGSQVQMVNVAAARSDAHRAEAGKERMKTLVEQAAAALDPEDDARPAAPEFRPEFRAGTAAAGQAPAGTRAARALLLAALRS